VRRGRQKSEHTDSSVHQCRNAPYFCPTLTQKCGSILCLPTEVGRKHTQRQAHVERHLYLLGQKYSWGMLHTYTKHAFVCVCACVCMCVCVRVCASARLGYVIHSHQACILMSATLGYASHSHQACICCVSAKLYGLQAYAGRAIACLSTNAYSLSL
jgi:hypothetical protein